MLLATTSLSIGWKLKRIRSERETHVRTHREHSFFLIHLVGVESKLGPLGTSATEWPIIPAPGDYGDGEFGGMKIGRGNRSTRRKRAQAPLCSTQIPLDKTRARTRAAAVGWLWLVFTVFGRSNAGIVGSNRTQGMDVCVCFYSVFMLSCV
jgi:hypothetical protein